MPKLDACPKCSGRGNFVCHNCPCKTCGASGQVTVRCSNCSSGKVHCASCSGTGQVVVKKTWFSEKYGPHSLCGGSGRVPCQTCRGTAQVTSTCGSCKGTRRNPVCGTCGGKGTCPCANCKGTGRVLSDWYRSLAKLPQDRLRFEYEKRQSAIMGNRQKISIIQTKISRLSAEYEDAYAEYDADRRARPWLYEEAGSWPGIIDSHPRAMSRLESEASDIESSISEIEDEMEAIEEVMNSHG
jgi:hypothetical protein